MVDRGLMLLMAVLLAQSAYAIFFAAADSATAENIDIVVRASAAAIFGYFLSASFAAQKTAGVPTVSGGHMMEMRIAAATARRPEERSGLFPKLPSGAKAAPRPVERQSPERAAAPCRW